MLPWQKRTMAIILWKNSLRAILRIMFSYYKPIKYIDIICTTTSIIYTFNTRGQTFKPTSSSFKLLKTMNIICNMEFIIDSAIYKSIETCPIILNNTTNCQKAYCKYLWKKPKLFTNKSPWGIKTHGKHVLWLFCRMHTTWPKRTSPIQKTSTKGKGLRVDNQPLFITNQKEKLETHTREPSLWEWTKGCPISFLPPST